MGPLGLQKLPFGSVMRLGSPVIIGTQCKPLFSKRSFLALLCSHDALQLMKVQKIAHPLIEEATIVYSFAKFYVYNMVEVA